VATEFQTGSSKVSHMILGAYV